VQQIKLIFSANFAANEVTELAQQIAADRHRVGGDVGGFKRLRRERRGKERREKRENKLIFSAHFAPNAVAELAQQVPADSDGVGSDIRRFKRLRRERKRKTKDKR
jgi:hypothetical protein